jgi:hypothetical protein
MLTHAWYKLMVQDMRKGDTGTPQEVHQVLESSNMIVKLLDVNRFCHAMLKR